MHIEVRFVSVIVPEVVSLLSSQQEHLFLFHIRENLHEPPKVREDMWGTQEPVPYGHVTGPHVMFGTRGTGLMTHGSHKISLGPHPRMSGTRGTGLQRRPIHV